MEFLYIVSFSDIDVVKEVGGTAVYLVKIGRYSRRLAKIGKDDMILTTHCCFFISFDFHRDDPILTCLKCVSQPPACTAGGKMRLFFPTKL